MREEMSRRVAVRSLHGGGPEGRTDQVVEARPEELPAVARRLSVPAVVSLRCRFALGSPDRNGVVAAEGELDAQVERICVVSLDAFTQAVSERFAVRFVPGLVPDAPDGPDGEAVAGPLDPDEIDEIGYANGAIDLGEAAVEQLALCLDPYPRRPDLPAEAGTTPAGGEADGVPPARPNPFAVLDTLKPTRH